MGGISEPLTGVVKVVFIGVKNHTYNLQQRYLETFGRLGKGRIFRPEIRRFGCANKSSCSLAMLAFLSGNARCFDIRCIYIYIYYVCT